MPPPAKRSTASARAAGNTSRCWRAVFAVGARPSISELPPAGCRVIGENPHPACTLRQVVDTAAMLGFRTVLVFHAMVVGLGAESRPVTAEVAASAPMVTRLELTGSVAASHRSQLSPRIPGLILKTHVDAGVMVKAGDVLMELDPELAELQLELMERELAQARIELKDAERLLAEGTALASRGAFPTSEAASRQTSLDVKQASVDQIEARMKLQRSIIERHRLVAPYDGVISRRLADDGEWVQTGVPVVELVSLENPRLDVQVP